MGGDGSLTAASVKTLATRKPLLLNKSRTPSSNRVKPFGEQVGDNRRASQHQHRDIWETCVEGKRGRHSLPQATRDVFLYPPIFLRDLTVSECTKVVLVSFLESF